MRKRKVRLNEKESVSTFIVCIHSDQHDRMRQQGESVEATEAVENTESTEEVPAVPLAQYDLKGSDYVTLCDYSAIPVTISGDYDVTDQDVLDYVEKIFTQGGPLYG